MALRKSHGSALVRMSAFTMLILVITRCGPATSDRHQQNEAEMPERSIEEVREAMTPEWMEIPGVVGTGIARCDERPCIRVFLSRPSSEAERIIPNPVEGHPVEFVVTGPVRPREPRG